MLVQILFLNKNDLFEQKILHSDIKNFFPVCLHPSVRVYASKPFP